MRRSALLARAHGKKAQRVPFRGAWTPVMNEYFASTADVHRILGELPEQADRLPPTDSRANKLYAVGSPKELPFVNVHRYLKSLGVSRGDRVAQSVDSADSQIRCGAQCLRQRNRTGAPENRWARAAAICS